MNKTLGTTTTGKARCPPLSKTHVYGSHEMTEWEIKRFQGITISVIAHKPKDKNKKERVITENTRASTQTQTN